ncbi:hypothetical protein D3C84_705840 [compost metagenome]
MEIRTITYASTTMLKVAINAKVKRLLYRPWASPKRSRAPIENTVIGMETSMLRETVPPAVSLARILVKPADGWAAMIPRLSNMNEMTVWIAIEV